jgi:2-oxoglutarate dehydrogenase E2 component (dihydrolipoamide succinyltransferase)
MLIQVKVPSVGESITEGLLAEWVKRDGDYVRPDEPLFVLETDKVTMPINSEHAGRLKILVQTGEIVKIGQAVAEIDTAAKTEPTKQRINEPTGGGSASEEKPTRPELGTRESAPPSQPAGVAMHAPSGLPRVREKLSSAATEELSPAVRRLVEESRVDPAAVSASGKGGRLTKEDVVAFLSKRGASDVGSETASQRANEPTLGGQVFGGKPEHSALSTQHFELSSRQTRTPISPIRQRIAERVLLSQKSTATLTTFGEADMSEVIALRVKYKEAFQAEHGVGLGFMSFFVKAVVDALKGYPVLASFIDGGELVQNHSFDIGIAVSTERGLVVPVLRDADKKSLAEIEKDIANLAQRARGKAITLPELEGAVFSITNTGSYGALFGTPIINPPQSGILGTYAIQEKPVAREGQVVIRPMMVLALSYDHRVVDGESAGRFLLRVVEDLEHPARLMLEI